MIVRYPGGILVCGKRTYVMGILNVTPDSFSDGGDWIDPDRAVRRARTMVREGADIIDVGGESTRPGAPQVPAAEETRRVVPVIPLPSGQALGVAAAGYNGRVYFGLNADRDAVPDLELVRTGIEETLHDLSRVSA